MNNQQDQEIKVLDCFLQLVKSPYGDFTAINKLSHVLNDSTTLQKIVEFLSQTPKGKQTFIDCPLLGQIDLEHLHKFPKNTLGYMYADHMLRNGLTPIPIKDEVAKNKLMFLGAHIAETHDIWHVVTESDTDKAGEVKLEAFYVAQIAPDRLFIALLAKNLLKTAMHEIELCDQIMDGLTQGWIAGKRSKPLFGIQWNKLWETPLEDIQKSLNILPI